MSVSRDGRGIGRALRALRDDAAMIASADVGDSARGSRFLKVGHHPIARYYRWREITMAATNEAFSEPAVNPRHSTKSREDALASRRLRRRESFEADLNFSSRNGSAASKCVVRDARWTVFARTATKYGKICELTLRLTCTLITLMPSPRRRICSNPARRGRIGNGNGNGFRFAFPRDRDRMPLLRSDSRGSRETGLRNRVRTKRLCSHVCNQPLRMQLVTSLTLAYGYTRSCMHSGARV